MTPDQEPRPVTTEPAEIVPASTASPSAETPPDPEALISLYLRTLDSPQTIKTYNTEIRMFLSYMSEHFGRGVGDLSAEDISRYREYLLGTYSSATAAKKLTCMRRFLTFTYMGGVSRISPESLRFFARSPKVRQDSSYNILTEDELSRMLSAARTENYRDYVMLAVMVSCGLREAELVGIRIGDFRESGAVHDGQDIIHLRVLGKGDKTRNVPVSPDLWSLVQRFVIHSGRTFTSQNDARKPLFESREGRNKPLTTRAVRYMVKKYVRKAGITKPVSPHSIRHTVGTNMAVNEAPLLIIQQFLGHSDPKTTMRYIRRAEEISNRSYEYNTLRI